jgi:gluconokinase
VYLAGSFDLINERMMARRDHFMKPEMLRSQFEALEAPTDAIMVDVAKSPDAVADEIRERLGLLEAGRHQDGLNKTVYP